MDHDRKSTGDDSQFVVARAYKYDCDEAIGILKKCADATRAECPDFEISQDELHEIAYWFDAAIKWYRNHRPTAQLIRQWQNDLKTIQKMREVARVHNRDGPTSELDDLEWKIRSKISFALFEKASRHFSPLHWRTSPGRLPKVSEFNQFYEKFIGRFLAKEEKVADTKTKAFNLFFSICFDLFAAKSGIKIFIGCIYKTHYLPLLGEVPDEGKTFLEYFEHVRPSLQCRRNT